MGNCLSSEKSSDASNGSGKQMSSGNRVPTKAQEAGVTSSSSDGTNNKPGQLKSNYTMDNSTSNGNNNNNNTKGNPSSSDPNDPSRGSSTTSANSPLANGQNKSSSAPGSNNNNNNNNSNSIYNNPNGKQSNNNDNQGQSLNSTNNQNGTVTTTTNGNSNDDSSNRPEVKMLLLGSGESGKSTILKQMKILHQNGYSQEDLVMYKTTVYKNLLDCAKAIVKALEQFDIKLNEEDSTKNSNTITTDADNNTDELKSSSSDIITDNNNNTNNSETNIKDDSNTNNNSSITNNNTHDKKHTDLTSIPPASSSTSDSTALTPTTATKNNNSNYPSISDDELEFIQTSIISPDPDSTFDPELATIIAKLWAHPLVKELWTTRRSQFYIMDSAPYFFANVQRISDPDYIPNVADILRARIKTTGIYETQFQMGRLNIHMYDVGGQRSERKKWIHCFDNVTIIIFCVALSEYDQVLLEETTQNRMAESLVLFDSIINSRWFVRTSIVLFLNKIDVFTEKLPHSPLENYFPDYNGGNNIKKAAKYILWRFTQLNRNSLNIYPHITQATDTSNIRLVFAAVKETILQNSLKDSGLL